MASWLPHGRFQGKEQKLNPAPKLFNSEIYTIGMPAACSETPGATIENAFLILKVLWHQQPWRIFVKLRIEVNTEGVPDTASEPIFHQLMGQAQKGNSIPS